MKYKTSSSIILRPMKTPFCFVPLIKFTSLFFILTSMTSCDKNSPADSTASVQQEYEDLAGAYIGPDFGSGEEDYVVIHEDGSLADYEKEIAKSDKGEIIHCFRARKAESRLLKISPASYADNEIDRYRRRLIFSGNELKVFYVFDGVVSDYHFTYIKMTNRSSTDFVPICGPK